MPKTLQKSGLGLRANDARVSHTKQQAAAREVCVVDHLHLDSFVSAERLQEALAQTVSGVRVLGSVGNAIAGEGGNKSVPPPREEM